MRTEIFFVKKDRTDKSGNRRAEVNRQVEPSKGARKQMLIAWTELISDMRRNAWLYPSCAERDKQQPDKQPDSGVVQCQGKVTETINDRKRQNRPIFAEKSVRNDRA